MLFPQRTTVHFHDGRHCHWTVFRTDGVAVSATHRWQHNNVAFQDNISWAQDSLFLSIQSAFIMSCVARKIELCDLKHTISCWVVVAQSLGDRAEKVEGRLERRRDTFGTLWG